MVNIREYQSDDLEGVIALCKYEGWLDYAYDPNTLTAALSAPGVYTHIALDDEGVVGFAQVLSDGHLRSYLALMVVRHDARGKGIGTALVQAAQANSTTDRLDLIASEDSVEFYRSFPYRERRGFILQFSDTRPASGDSSAGV